MANDSTIQIYEQKKGEILALSDAIEAKEYIDKASTLKAYHQKQNADIEIQNHWGEMVARGKRRLGQLIQQGKADGTIEDGKGGQNIKAGSHDGTPLLMLRDIGINKNESSRSQKMADMSEDTFEERIDELKEKGEQITNAAIMKTAHVSNNSGENEWYTPAKYIEAARRVMGGIDLDPASSDIANETVKATMYYTEESDGLSWDWNGRIWMNPPYAQPLINHFCDKLATDLDMGFVTEAITLTNNATETKWFRALFIRCAAVCFPDKRIRFIDVDGNSGKAPLQGQALLYFGENISKFTNEFKQFGPTARVLHAH